MELMCWYPPVIPAFSSQRQEDCEFKTNMVYIVRHCLKKKKRKANRKGSCEKQLFFISPHVDYYALKCLDNHNLILKVNKFQSMLYHNYVKYTSMKGQLIFKCNISFPILLLSTPFPALSENKYVFSSNTYL